MSLQGYGVEPTVSMADGETRIIQSSNIESSGSYTITRSGSRYNCSCPAWQNHEGAGRSCKHLKELLGTESNVPRILLTTDNMSESNPVSSNTKKRKGGGEENNEPPRKQIRRIADSKHNPLRPAERLEYPKARDPIGSLTRIDISSFDDPLICINGIMPKNTLTNQETRQVKSDVSDEMYTVKRAENHYYCTCPDWRNKSGPANLKTCKHLRDLLGEEYETARISSSMPSLTKLSYLSSENNPQGLLLAEKWEMTNDPTGYWISEKLDGIRAFWNGRALLSRRGIAFAAPDWFTDVLPTDISLDGELYAGRGKLQDVVSIVRAADGQLWSNGISYHIFDIVDRTGTIPFEERISRLQRLFPRKVAWVGLVDQEKCRSREHFQRKLDDVIRNGGEGLMLREPKSVYVPMRSRTSYKAKTFMDAEAVVVGYEPEKSRNKETCGALKCRTQSGKEFKIGTGLSDAVRQNPPKIVPSRRRGIRNDCRVRL